MCSRSATNLKGAIALTLIAATLAGCSDIYTDRRDFISLAAGETMAANRVTHTIDPWPAASANRTIHANGERMQGAVERYRRHQVIRPVSPTSVEWKSEPPAPLTTEMIQGGTQQKQ